LTPKSTPSNDHVLCYEGNGYNKFARAYIRYVQITNTKSNLQTNVLTKLTQ